MTKRPAEDPLDEPVQLDSPASKRPKIYSTEEPTDTTTHARSLTDRTEQRWNGNGHNLNEETATDEGGEKETRDTAAEESDLEEDDNRHRTVRQNAPLEGYDDLYLDTIQRAALDFDFEKLCSVSLSNINVYACLVCGKYYQGRGPKSHAYFHALEVEHHVFINMETKKVYVLPEGYEVKNKSLDDIKYVVDPHFSKEEVAKLDKTIIDAFDLSGKRYRPGFVGMNNIKSNDYLNVIVQLLAHVRPIRNFFLLHDFPALSTPQLPLRFGVLIRKLWNPRAFKAHVSPHELLQEVAIRSSKRFTLTKQSDPIEFLSWFLNNLHLTLGGSKKPSSKPTSVIQSAFHGKLRIESQAITARSDSANARLVFSESSTTTSQVNPFLMLTLDLPPTPLFQSSNKDSIIPQVPLTTLLNKYNGITASEKLAHRVRHRLLHPLPPYLLFHIKRFSKNKFVAERNPTIVTFPSPHGLDMSPYVEPDPSVWPPGEPIIYDLVANVILDAAVNVPGGPENAANSAETAKDLTDTGPSAASTTTPGAAAGNHKVSWLIQLHDKAMATENSQQQQQKGPEWLEAQDLWVKRTESETLFTREGYLMVWERRKAKPLGSK
ncbi:SnRNP assembly factor [Trichophyton interdigitale]|uniref:SnRNP assembly factor n=1 Tax=Trichophyton interdigitale TaxID=101480 RepID=A0A9P5CXN7_9EURO|nr:SnRNP assembly factor [Trichophyton interdigitale]KAF3895798.1 SnRNP assembly factor [Trichophyton interdigitale]KAG8208857.1 SnRNP assembly factor [Trichophyton interdigitale]